MEEAIWIRFDVDDYDSYKEPYYAGYAVGVSSFVKIVRGLMQGDYRLNSKWSENGFDFNLIPLYLLSYEVYVGTEDGGEFIRELDSGEKEEFLKGLNKGIRDMARVTRERILKESKEEIVEELERC